MNSLSDDNFFLYAAKSYMGPQYFQSEFEEDLKRIKYIKRLIKKYRVSGYNPEELKERLILNHIIILSNVFGIEPTVRMLFLKIEKDDYPILKTFLLFLNYMPKIVPNIRNNHILSSDITIDLIAGQKLQQI